MEIWIASYLSLQMKALKTKERENGAKKAADRRSEKHTEN
jgi:hypothetical protein